MPQRTLKNVLWQFKKLLPAAVSSVGISDVHIRASKGKM